ncbi:unnamed protein product [Candidula unifasciata]|uniref:Tyrosinase copper-binding domain-containing protein n=1 Tax=Candidula unifasciata TaxID=100452 RepID=A0A8S3ZTJ4_9EUPU|nr:unnamed protein product [Candidula unifasciata]
MTALGLILTLMVGLCEANIWEIPLPDHTKECYKKVQSADIQTYVGSTLSWLCENSIGNGQQDNPGQLDAQKISYYKHLLESSAQYLPNNTQGTPVSRRRRQATRQRCVRKEYRVLTDEERTRFHDAINTLKRDTTVEPNKYDAIALLHVSAVNSAHAGAGFMGWHRIYLLMFESALQEVDQSVCLPYWDSTLDNELQDPAMSSVWTPAFFGTPNGPVIHGPFANWTTPQGVQLIRNVGSDGELFTSTAIEAVLSRKRHEDIISSPQVEPRYDLEFYHGGVHMFCGGTMSQLDTAAFDPIFFLVHAFVDYIWELFRTSLRNNGVDPQRFPDMVAPESLHHSSAPTGFGNLLQSDGYRDAVTQTFEYLPPPVCSSTSPQCGSRYLSCLERIGRCVPINAAMAVSPLPDPTTTTTTPVPEIPVSKLPVGSDTSCLRQEKIYGQPIQNDFCCDKTCDTNEWVTIPVKVISVRPPKFNKYRSYPVHNGRVDSHYDIYSPRAYEHTNRLIVQRRSNPKTYKRCKGDDSVGQVLLSSRGINYHGFYKEAAIVDQRLAVSMSMGFVSVKKPTGDGVSKALIRAHDSCGRVCHAACKDPLTNQYKECKGAIAVSSALPLMYGTTYDEAVMSVFDYESNNALPQFKTSSFFLTFYCDYLGNFPYTDYNQSVSPQPQVATEPPAFVVPPTSSECFVTTRCTLDIPCASTERQCHLHNEKHACRGYCQAYGVCIYGRFFMKTCPEGHSFDNVLKICVPGSCQNSQGHTNSVPATGENTNVAASSTSQIPNNTGVQTGTSYRSGLLSNVLKNLVG